MLETLVRLRNIQPQLLPKSSPSYNDHRWGICFNLEIAIARYLMQPYSTGPERRVEADANTIRYRYSPKPFQLRSGDYSPSFFSAATCEYL